MSEVREQLLTIHDVAKRCKVGSKTVARWSKQLDHFPKPGKVGNTVRWRESEVNAFLASFGTGTVTARK